jgi:hypothetical protein
MNATGEESGQMIFQAYRSETMSEEMWIFARLFFVVP